MAAVYICITRELRPPPPPPPRRQEHSQPYYSRWVDVPVLYVTSRLMGTSSFFTCKSLSFYISDKTLSQQTIFCAPYVSLFMHLFISSPLSVFCICCRLPTAPTRSLTLSGTLRLAVYQRLFILKSRFGTYKKIHPGLGKRVR